MFSSCRVPVTFILMISQLFFTDILLGAVYGSCVSGTEDVQSATMLRLLADNLMSYPDILADRVLTKYVSELLIRACPQLAM